MTVLSKNRVKLTLKRNAPSIYFDGPAAPLQVHRGIMFPVQPDITYSQSVNYSPYDLVHTNYTYQAYRNTPSPDIQLTCQFASVTDDEARYTFAGIHFLRSITKMFFGKNQNSPVAGTPPPVLNFQAFGSQQFNNVPVVVTQFSTTSDSNVDLKLFDGDTQIPTLMNMFVGLAVQQTPDRQKNEFTTNDLISGRAYQNGFI